MQESINFNSKREWTSECRSISTQLYTLKKGLRWDMENWISVVIKYVLFEIVKIILLN